MNVKPIIVEMNAQEFIELEELQARNEAMAVKDASYELNGKTYKVVQCPVCDELIAGDPKFCKKCGQRLDTENIAF